MPDDTVLNPPLSKPSFVTDVTSASADSKTPVATENMETPPYPIVSGIPPVISNPKPKGKSKRGMVAAILGLLLLVGGVGAGVILVQRQQDIREKAAGGGWCGGICAPYHPGGMSCDGCHLMDGQTAEMVHFICDGIEPSGQGCGYDNGEEIFRGVVHERSFLGRDCGMEQIDASNGSNNGWGSVIYDVPCEEETPQPTPTPTLPPTPTPTPTPSFPPTPTPTPLTCDDVCNPNSDLCPSPLECRLVGVGGGVFANVCRNPQCEYETDCTCGATPSPTPSPTPSHTPTPTPTGTTPPGFFQCLALKAYNTSWTLLSISDLQKLKVGDKVRFAVAGSTSYGDITKAMFSINNMCVETSLTKPVPNPCSTCSPEFYYEYTIPSGVTSFTVDARLYVEGRGWMGGMSSINMSCQGGTLPTPLPSVD